MKVTSTLNNDKIKYLDSWVDYGYENNGVDILVTEKGEIIFINWKRYKRETTLW